MNCKELKLTVRAWCIAVLTVIFCCLPGMKAMASAYTPNNVSSLQVVSYTETTVHLAWSDIYNATGYYVYMTDVAAGKTKQVAKTSGITCRISGLKLGKKYRFQVYSYYVRRGTIYRSARSSPVVTVKTATTVPGTVENLRVASAGDRTLTLKWKPAAGCSGYMVYCYDKNAKKYKKVGRSIQPCYVAKGLKAGTRYSFKVRSYHNYQRTITYGEWSEKVTGKAKAMNLSTVHGRYFNATVKSTCKATLSNGKKKTLSGGTRVILTASSGNKASILLNGKTKATVSRSNLSLQNLNTTTKYYTNEQAEAYVNSKSYTSPTDYLIWISQYTLATYVFKGSDREWKLVRKMPCVVGKNGNTPAKLHHIVKKGHKYGDVILYIAWFPGIQSGYGFHARVNSTSRGAASGGCIRLGGTDLHWLNQHCGIGTTVLSS